MNGAYAPRGPLHNKSRSLKSPLTAVNGVLRCIIKPRPLFVANIPVNYGFFLRAPETSPLSLCGLENGAVLVVG